MAKRLAAGIYNALRSAKQGGQPKIDRSNDDRPPKTVARFVRPAKVMVAKLAAVMFAGREVAVRVVTDLAEALPTSSNRRGAELEDDRREFHPRATAPIVRGRSGSRLCSPELIG